MGTFDRLDAKGLHLLALGVGNAFTRRFFPSSLLLVAGRRAVLVDCPAPLRRILGDAGRTHGLDIDIADIGHVVLTHLHGDHCNGIEEFGFYAFHELGGRRAHLYLLPEVAGPLWENRLSASMGNVMKPAEARAAEKALETYFQVHTWEQGAAHRLAGGGPAIEFRIRRTRHSLPCLAFRATFEGRTLGYSADTAHDPELIDFLAPADLIIHETGPGGNHTPLEELARLPEALRRKMRLIHAPDDYHDRDDLPIELLKQGEMVRV